MRLDKTESGNESADGNHTDLSSIRGLPTQLPQDRESPSQPVVYLVRMIPEATPVDLLPFASTSFRMDTRKVPPRNTLLLAGSRPKTENAPARC
jgi:hypothetical protein